MGSLEAAEDVMGEVSIEDITECIPKAASTVDIESAGRRNRLVKKTAELLEAERNLRGKIEEELKDAEKELGKQRRKYRARRIIQSLQEKQNQNEVCVTLYCENEKRTTCDRQKMERGAVKYSRSKYQDEE